MRIIKSFAGFAFAPARTTTDTARPRRHARVVVDDAFNRTEPDTETETEDIIIVREMFRDTLSKLTPSSSPHVEHTALKTRG